MKAFKNSQKNVCVCVCVCVFLRERQREKETERNERKCSYQSKYILKATTVKTCIITTFVNKRAMEQSQ